MKPCYPPYMGRSGMSFNVHVVEGSGCHVGWAGTALPQKLQAPRPKRAALSRTSSGKRECPSSCSRPRTLVVLGALIVVIVCPFLLYVCMCVYVHTYVCTYACMHACMYACMRACMHVFVLSCLVDSCLVLSCIVPYSIVLYCSGLDCIVSYCIVLYNMVLYCIAVYCILLYCKVL